MSTTTTNFDIVLPEGSDTFNPLTFNNNAFARVDEVMKANQDRGNTTATHTYIDGINTILRAVASCNLFTFVASADYVASSQTSVDGVPVTVRYADGTAPKDNAFRTNQAVVCYLNGSILTIVSAKSITNGIDVTIDNSSLGANVQELSENVLARLNAVDNYIHTFVIPHGGSVTIHSLGSANGLLLLGAGGNTGSMHGVYVVTSAGSQHTRVNALTENLKYNFNVDNLDITISNTDATFNAYASLIGKGFDIG